MAKLGLVEHAFHTTLFVRFSQAEAILLYKAWIKRIQLFYCEVFHYVAWHGFFGGGGVFLFYFILAKYLNI